MSIDARSIALQGIGFGARRVALQGFGFDDEAPEPQIILPPRTRTAKVVERRRDRDDDILLFIL